MLCFALFCYLRTISKYKAPGAYIQRGDLKERFLRYEFAGGEGGGAYTWRGLYMERLVFGILRCVKYLLSCDFEFANFILFL